MSYEQRVLADIASSLDRDHERQRRKQQQQQQHINQLQQQQQQQLKSQQQQQNQYSQQQTQQQSSNGPIAQLMNQEPLDLRPKQVTRGFSIEQNNADIASKASSVVSGDATFQVAHASTVGDAVKYQESNTSTSSIQTRTTPTGTLYSGNLNLAPHLYPVSHEIAAPASLPFSSMKENSSDAVDRAASTLAVSAMSPILTPSTSIASLNANAKIPTVRPTATRQQQVPTSLRYDDQKKRLQVERRLAVTRKKSQKEISLFSHLQQYEREHVVTENIRNIHPAIVQVGLKFKHGVISGANARCVATLEALKLVINDYVAPPSQILKRHLDTHLKPMINYLVQFRPMAISMGNAIRFLRTKIATLESDMLESDAKRYLCDFIDSFINERIVLADQVIASSGASKINDGDVILTYGKSSVVLKTLLEAQRARRRFRVVIIDAGPKFEGKLLFESVLEAGIECTYTLMNGVSYVMNEVSKVFLGAHGMYSNGTLIARAGTAMVALMASNRNVPVMVCCETYKFSDRVQLDAFVFNELGDPEDLVMVKGQKSKSLLNWREIPSLKLLNLVYDVTPADYINMVITEIGMIPCTSVPVVLREYHSQWSI